MIITKACNPYGYQVEFLFNRDEIKDLRSILGEVELVIALSEPQLQLVRQIRAALK